MFYNWRIAKTICHRILFIHLANAGWVPALCQPPLKAGKIRPWAGKHRHEAELVIWWRETGDEHTDKQMGDVSINSVIISDSWVRGSEGDGQRGRQAQRLEGLSQLWRGMWASGWRVLDEGGMVWLIKRSAACPMQDGIWRRQGEKTKPEDQLRDMMWSRTETLGTGKRQAEF